MITADFRCMSRLFLYISLIGFLCICANPVSAKKYKNANYKFVIDIPERYQWTEKTDNNLFSLMATAEDGGSGFTIAALAVDKADSRFTYAYFESLDTLLFRLPERVDETKHFFSGYIDRKYAPSNSYNYQTRSVYTEDICYVILLYSLKEDDRALNEIVGSFFATHHGGPVNFLIRCIYQYVSDSTWGSSIGTIVFSLGFTILFWFGIFQMFHKSIVRSLMQILLFVLLFSYIAVHNAFLDFLYGFETFWRFAVKLLLLFVDD